MSEKNNSNPFKDEEGKIEDEVLNSEETTEEEVSDAAQQPSEEGKDLQSEVDDLNNKYLRLAADFDNYRKRQTQERESLLKYGAQETLTKLLAVLDTIDRANASMEGLEECEKVKESYQVVFKQLDDALEKCGLEKIEAQGQQFNPEIHDAVMKTPTSEHPEGYIIAELQTGYKLGDKVLRPALVNVAAPEA